MTTMTLAQEFASKTAQELVSEARTASPQRRAAIVDFLARAAKKLEAAVIEADCEIYTPSAVSPEGDHRAGRCGYGLKAYARPRSTVAMPPAVDGESRVDAAAAANPAVERSQIALLTILEVLARVVAEGHVGSILLLCQLDDDQRQECVRDIPQVFRCRVVEGSSSELFSVVSANTHISAVCQDENLWGCDLCTVPNVSSPSRAITPAIGFAGTQALAANRGNWKHVVCAFVDLVIRGHRDNDLEGMKTGHSTIARLMLRELRKHLPLRFMVSLSTLPEDYAKPHILERAIDENIVFDNSLFVVYTIPGELRVRLDCRDCALKRIYSTPHTRVYQVDWSKGQVRTQVVPIDRDPKELLSQLARLEQHKPVRVATDKEGTRYDYAKKRCRRGRHGQYADVGPGLFTRSSASALNRRYGQVEPVIRVRQPFNKELGTDKGDSSARQRVLNLSNCSVEDREDTPRLLAALRRRPVLAVA